MVDTPHHRVPLSLTSLFLTPPKSSSARRLAEPPPKTPFSTQNREPCNTQLGSHPAAVETEAGLTASADSDSGLFPGSRGARRTRRESRGRRLRLSSWRSSTPPRAPQPRQSRLQAFPGPGRTPLTSQATAAPRGAEPGPGGRVPAGRPGWEPGAGWGVSPGRGWVPQRRFQLFRCLKLAPAERCGHVTERRQSAPACLRVPAPNARRPEERRPRPGGRVRRPRSSRGGGRDAGTRGRADRGQQPAPPRPGPPCLRGRLPSGAAYATPPVSYPLGYLWIHRRAQPSLLRGVQLGFLSPDLRLSALRPAPVCGRLHLGPSPEVSGRSFFRTLRKSGRYSGRPGRPSPGLTGGLMEREPRMR